MDALADQPEPLSARRPELVVLGGLAVAAGAGLWLWSTSPASRWLDHDSTALEATPLMFVAVFTSAWVLMTVAVMLPSATPLLEAFGRVTAARPRRGRLLAAVAAGFLAAWTIAGVVAAVADLGLHRTVERTPFLQRHVPLVTAGVLALAGGYQLSGVLSRCLRACRSPMGFLGRHWSGDPDVHRQALVIGADYGRSCLGCCAPLMVMMLALGMGDLAWVFLLGLVGAIQKHASWGHALVVPTGVVLLIAAGTVAIRHLAV